MDIIISDKMHINKRNFESLFKFFEQENLNVISFVDDWNENPLNGKVGNYRDLVNNKNVNYRHKIKEDTKNYQDKGALENYEYKGFHLWPLISSELSAFTIAESMKSNKDFPYLSKDLFNYHYEHYLEDLVLNYSVACYWIDAFESLANIIWKCKLAYVFSGSYIYTKVMLAALKKSPVRTFVIESTFLGNSFYCDEQNEHLPNNYLHQYKNSRTQAIKKSISNLKIDYGDADKIDYLRSKSLNKFMSMDNKNVKQPKPGSIERFKDISKRSVLLICQVLNDFSILESKKVINSIEHYKKIILEILENTDFNIVIKTHPWEKSKIHLTDSFTFKSLNSFIFSLNKSQKDRVVLDEDVNIYHLFSNVDGVLTYCSQAGIEAALYGKKAIVNEECSYGGAGFTFEYSDISIIPDLLKNNLDLDILEFKMFLDFMVAFDYMTIGKEASSLSKFKSALIGVPKLAEYHRSLQEVSISPFYK